MHRQLVSMESILEIMKRFYCPERMFIARSHETLIVQPPRNRIILYRISRDWVLRNHWSRIVKDARLKEPTSSSRTTAVPRLDTLTTKVGKSTLVQC